MDFGQRSELRRLLALSRASRGKGNAARKAERQAPAMPEPYQAPPPHTHRTCQWPGWPDGEKPPRPPLFCGAPTRPGGPYCRDHAAIAYEAK